MPKKKRMQSKKYPTRHQVEGVLQMNKKGIGYVTVEGMKEDVEIEPGDLATGLNGDHVRILLHPKVVGQRISGEVTKILYRNKMRFVGILKNVSGQYYLEPDDERMYADIHIPQNALHNAHVGEKALAKIESWPEQKIDPIGSIVEVLGAPGKHETEMRSIVLDRGFDMEIPEPIIKEAAGLSVEITEHERKIRRDFRGTPTLTIDPVDAKDFDDAISITTTEEGDLQIGVHIADVSHYVKPGTLLDKEAATRGTSIYLVDRTIPMLPEHLSNNLCSLRPDEDRFAFSAVFTMDHKGVVHDSWFGKTIIRSNRRFTYEDAQTVLDTNTGDFVEELRTLNKIAKKLRNNRMKAGAIAFEQEEVRIELDKQGAPIRIYKKPILATNLLIEEFMLLANRSVAEYIAKTDSRTERLFIYRIHGDPDIDKVSELAQFLKTIGYKLDTKGGKVRPQDINKLLMDVRGKAEESMIQLATIRTMSKAVYSTKNIGHYGLGFKYYTHFTSPIRRYPDLLVHRLLETYLGGHTLPDKAISEFQHLAMYSSQMEIAASDAERASIKYKKVEYMKNKVGHTFTGVITGVTKWGLFVEDKETKAEGLVSMRSIPDDFYFLQEKRYRIVGKTTRRAYTLGDTVSVRIIAVDLNRQTIDLEFTK